MKEAADRLVERVQQTKPLDKNGGFEAAISDAMLAFESGEITLAEARRFNRAAGAKLRQGDRELAAKRKKLEAM